MAKNSQQWLDFLENNILRIANNSHYFLMGFLENTNGQE